MLRKLSLLFILRNDLCKSKSSKRSQYTSHCIMFLTELKCYQAFNIKDNRTISPFHAFGFVGREKGAVVWKGLLADTVHQCTIFTFISIINLNLTSFSLFYLSFYMCILVSGKTLREFINYKEVSLTCFIF